MKHGIYNIYDKVGDMYSHPLIFKNDIIAERSFDSSIMSIKEPTKQPEDYELNKIGFYDDETGKIEVIDMKLIKKGSQTLYEQQAQKYDHKNEEVK